MDTEILSKSELLSLATKNKDRVDKINELISNISNYASDANDIDDINVSGAAKTLTNSLKESIKDVDTVVTNILSYAALINDYDVNDFLDQDGTLRDDTSNVKGDSELVIPTETPVDNTTNQNNQHTVDTSYVANDVYYSSNTQSRPVQYVTSAPSNNVVADSSGMSWSTIPTVVPSTPTSGPTRPSSGQTVDAIDDIKEEVVYKSRGKTTSNGRTQRSALTDIIIRPTKVDDPEVRKLDISKYHNNEAYGFKVTVGNLAYELCDEDIDLLCAIVSAESDKSYDDALAVITTILNRCETSNWINSHGRDPIEQATAPNQFVVYQHGSYVRYMNGNAPDTVKQAVADALAGVRNHKYCSFRSNGSTSYSNNMISPTGNRYK